MVKNWLSAEGDSLPLPPIPVLGGVLLVLVAFWLGRKAGYSFTRDERIKN